MKPLFSPAAQRNREPILRGLREWFPHRGKILEIASGTGQHGHFFVQQAEGWTWQPTDVSDSSLESIQGHQRATPNSRFLSPMELDVCDRPWKVEGVDGIFCANLIHIAPWECAEALFSGASTTLAAGGRLILYGPFLEADVPTAPSNLEFDAHLRQEDSGWGIRSLDRVKEVAEKAGFQFLGRKALPANNLLLSWEKAQ